MTMPSPTLTNNECCDKQKAQLRHNQEDKLYNALEVTQPIVVEDGSVTFCQHFKYLGSFISFNLCNNYDIKNESPLPPNQWGPSRMFGTPPTLTFGANILSSAQYP
jgi:hypothetical protein